MKPNLRFIVPCAILASVALSGPAAAQGQAGAPSLTNTTATFAAPGVYTLLLSASNGVHAVAYDAVVVSVSQAIIMTATRSGSNLNLSWSGGTPPFVVERATNLITPVWSGFVTTSVQTASVPISPGNAFFRVRGN